MKNTIKKLVEAYGPSGYEDQVRALIRDEIEGLVDEVRVDAMGNLIALKGKQTGDQGLKVMLAAHMDEIGVMVSYIDEKGFARFTTIGGVLPHTLVGGRVRFADGTIGTINVEKEMFAWHDKLPGIDKMYIDVGATSRDDAPVKVGDAAGFVRPMVQMGNRLVAKSMDDRVSCAILIETLRQLETTPHAI